MNMFCTHAYIEARNNQLDFATEFCIDTSKNFVNTTNTFRVF